MRYDEAETLAREAVQGFREYLGRHELTATAMQNLARALGSGGHYRPASGHSLQHDDAERFVQ